MKRLDLYILAECLPTFLLSLAVFSLVLLLQKIAEMFDLVAAKGVPVWEVAKMLLLLYPSLLSLVLPVSLLLAVLLAMGRLSADSEVVVMRACGVSLRQNLRPVFTLSALVMALCLVVTLWLAPAGRREFKRVILDTVVGRLNVSAQEGTFTELSPGVWLYAEKIAEEGGRMEGIFLHTEVGKLANTVVTAVRGSIGVGQGGFELNLEEAQFHQPKPDGSYTKTTARTSRIILPTNQPTGDPDDITARDFSTPDLYRMAFFEGWARGEMEFYRRFTVPVSCLMLGLLGGALGCHHFRAGNSRGLALCLVVLFLNYALFTLGDTLARRKTVSVAFSMWLPDMILGLMALYAIWMKNRERQFSLETALWSWFDRLKGFMAPGEKPA